MSFIIAIDGPAGSGKGTVTKILAKKLGLVNIDTGATYRCVTLAAIEQGYNIENKEEIIELSRKNTNRYGPRPKGIFKWTRCNRKDTFKRSFPNGFSSVINKRSKT